MKTDLLRQNDFPIQAVLVAILDCYICTHIPVPSDDAKLRAELSYSNMTMLQVTILAGVRHARDYSSWLLSHSMNVGECLQP